MKFGLLVVVILATIFCIVTGRVVEEGNARAIAGVGGRGLLLQQLCKNDTAVENNMIVCLICRRFSRLCFTMANTTGFSSSPSTSKPSSSEGGSSSTTATSASPSDGGGEESGKSI